MSRGGPEQLTQPKYVRNPDRGIVIDKVYPHPVHWLDRTPINRRPADLLTDIRHRRYLHKRRKKKDPKILHEPMLVQHEIPVTARKMTGIYKWPSVAATVAASAAASALLYPYFHFNITWDTQPSQGADKSHSRTVIAPEPVPVFVNDNSRTLTIHFPSGKATASGEKKTVQRFVGELEQDQKNGEIFTGGTAIGRGSPDWVSGGTQTLTQSGQDNTLNYILGRARAAELLKDFTVDAVQADLALPEIKTHVEVNGLTKAQQRQLNKLLARHGETLAQNFGQLFNQFDAGQKLTPDLQDAMQTIIGNTRSATISIDREHLVFPPATGTGPEPPQPTPLAPVHHDFPIPLLVAVPVPIPRTEEVEETITEFTLEDVARNLPNPMWVWLYPEAKISQNSLAKNTFLYSRLGQIMLREDRIPKVITHKYRDDTDKDQTVRALFMDHEPTDGAKEYTKQVMQKLSYALGGKIGDYLDTIGVYPQEILHRKRNGEVSAKQVGLGIDQQEDEGVVGLAIPLLRYAEILAPMNPTQKDFDSIDGFVGTLVHELTGHYGDHNGLPITINPINEAKNTYFSNNPWNGTAIEVAGKYPSPKSRKPEELQFEITVREPERGVTTYLVNGDDPRLKRAFSARLMNAAPTDYGASHYLELFAEATRQVVTGKLIPFDEANINIHHDGEDAGEYAQGYAVSHELQELVAKRLGAEVDGIGLKWPEETIKKRETAEFIETTIEGDEEMLAMAAYAKSTAQPRKRKMIKVLTSSSGIIV